MACSLVGLRRNLFYYHKSKPKNESDQRLIYLIKEIREKYGNLGAKKIAKLLSKNDRKINHKRIARITKENNLIIVRKRQRRHREKNVERLPLPIQINEINSVWSIDFMCARKSNKFRFMLFNVIDIYSRQAQGMVVERSFTSLDVTCELEKIFAQYGKPSGIITDNGAEFIATNFRVWCKRNKIVHYITNVASPAENCFVESFNSSVRREVLDTNDFDSMNKLREKIAEWRVFYNTERPHGSLGYISPEEYIKFEKTKKQAV